MFEWQHVTLDDHMRVDSSNAAADADISDSSNGDDDDDDGSGFFFTEEDFENYSVSVRNNNDITRFSSHSSNNDSNVTVVDSSNNTGDNAIVSNTQSSTGTASAPIGSTPSLSGKRTLASTVCYDEMGESVAASDSDSDNNSNDTGMSDRTPTKRKIPTASTSPAAGAATATKITQRPNKQLKATHSADSSENISTLTPVTPTAATPSTPISPSLKSPTPLVPSHVIPSFLVPPPPPPPGFPRWSWLSRDEHKLYLELQQKMMKDQLARSTPVSPSAPPVPLVMTSNDMALFSRLRPIVMKEQEEYRAFLAHEATTNPANKEPYLYMHPQVRQQLDAIFSLQRQRVLQMLPRYYDVRAAFDIRAIAVAPSDPVLKHLRTLLQVVCDLLRCPSFLTSLSKSLLLLLFVAFFSYCCVFFFRAKCLCSNHLQPAAFHCTLFIILHHPHPPPLHL